VDAKTVSSILGHYSAGFTLDAYAHATSDMQRDAAQKMGNFMTQAMWNTEKKRGSTWPSGPVLPRNFLVWVLFGSGCDCTGPPPSAGGGPSSRWGGNKSTRRIATKKERLRPKEEFLEKVRFEKPRPGKNYTALNNKRGLRLRIISSKKFR